MNWGSGAKKPLKSFFQHLEPSCDRHLYKQLAAHELMIVGKKLVDGSYLIICSNQHNKEGILKTYQKRWDIESMFKNLKTQGFNLEDTHMTCLERLKKLMAVVAIALFILCLVGCHQTCPYKKTVRAPLYSVFTKGLKWIKHLLKTSPPHFEQQFLAILNVTKISEG